MLNFENLSVPELEKKLLALQDLLEEVEEERTIILGQENLHLSSKLVQKYQLEIEDIKQDIESVKQLLSGKESLSFFLQ
jgi:hypothetical protein